MYQMQTWIIASHFKKIFFIGCEKTTRHCWRSILYKLYIMPGRTLITIRLKILAHGIGSVLDFCCLRTLSGIGSEKEFYKVKETRANPIDNEDSK